LIKTPMLEVLPEGAYARWRPFSSPAILASVRQWLLAACGVLAGAFTHVVLDAFTHENARGVRMIPWLEEPIVEIGNHHIAGLWLLQDGSSLFGLVVVIGLIWYGLRPGLDAPVPNRPLGPPERHVWVAVYVVAAIALSIAWLLLWVHFGETRGRYYVPLANRIAISALRGLATALLCTSLALDWRLRSLAQRSERSLP
jgi:hypothetical protein